MPEMAERSLRSVCREKREREKGGGAAPSAKWRPGENYLLRKMVISDDQLGKPGKWDDDDG